MLGYSWILKALKLGVPPRLKIAEIWKCIFLILTLLPDHSYRIPGTQGRHWRATSGIWGPWKLHETPTLMISPVCLLWRLSGCNTALLFLNIEKNLGLTSSLSQACVKAGSFIRSMLTLKENENLFTSAHIFYASNIHIPVFRILPKPHEKS